MRIAVLQFPGSNCDQDALFALRDQVGVQSEYVWHQESSLAGFDGVFLPGGFSYGDYLRCGAMAARAPIMAAVREMAQGGAPVIGVCNGFQVLCEAGLLPGALMLNESQRFVCQDVTLQAVNRASRWTAGVSGPIRIPVAHGEGRYLCSPEVLRELQDQDRIAFRYVGENPNGSMDNIAGILNAAGNVLGMMPHPERAVNPLLGGTDGLQILRAFQLVRS